jgi:hypothetical protein
LAIREALRFDSSSDDGECKKAEGNVEAARFRLLATKGN